MLHFSVCLLIKNEVNLCQSASSEKHLTEVHEACDPTLTMASALLPPLLLVFAPAFLAVV